MEIRIIRLLEMFRRVQQFGVAHATAFLDGSRAKELFGLVAAAVSAIQGYALAQENGRRSAKESTALKKLALKRLRKSLETVSRMARAIALTIPGFDERFRLPRSLSEEEYLTLARAFANYAEPVADQFFQRGLPEDFFDNLTTQVVELEALINSHAQKRGEHVAARAAGAEAAERGRKAVRELDEIVRNVFADNPDVLADWESASHVERPPRHNAKEKPPAEPAPAAA